MNTYAKKALVFMLDRWRRSGAANNDDAGAADVMAGAALTRAQFEVAAQQLERAGLVRIDGFLANEGEHGGGAPNEELVLTDAAKRLPPK